MSVSYDEALAIHRKKLLRELVDVDLAREHIHFFSHHVKCLDSRSGELFQFTMLTEEEAKEHGYEYRGKDWFWQREYLDDILETDQSITLKGRQLGITWIWALRGLHTALFKPGSDVLVYSIKEDDAVAVINRIWDMWLSLPEHFKHDIEVLKPARGARPSTTIELRHPDGKVSTIHGMAATKSAGHGRSAALVIFDEASRQEYARDLWKAVIPAMGDKGGVIGVVSTANGMSDGKGKGNFFHELWVGAGGPDYPKLKTAFLKWDLHPDRDQAWYDSLPMGQAEKAEQYPNDPQEAFLLSGNPFFDIHALKWYTTDAKSPEPERFRFVPYTDKTSKAALKKDDAGPLTVYVRPQADRSYAIGADVATGSGEDFSVAAVIDLADGTPVAELYMKADYEDFSEQLHFLGKWYNTARLAVEKGGGYGDVVISHLRDGHKGRQPYPRMYRHRSWDHPTRPTTVQLGYPMNQKTRAHVVSALSDWINEQLLPWMTPRWLNESRTFVYRETKPSPRAADGCNDDVVMAWGIALVMYGEFGHHEQSYRSKNLSALRKRRAKPLSALDPRARKET